MLSKNNSFFKLHKVDYICVAILLISALLLFQYNDLRSLTVWSMNFFDCLFHGNLKDYYIYTAQNLYNVPHQYAGNQMIGIFFTSILLFPVWLLIQIFHYPPATSFVVLLLAKLILVIVFLGVMHITGKVAEILNISKSNFKLLFFLCISSAFVIFSIGFCGQNDIYLLLAGMSGILQLLKGKTASFLLCFAIGAMIKPYILLLFFVVLLLSEKRISFIFLKSICIAFFSFLGYGIGFFFTGYSQSMQNGPGQAEFEAFFNSAISVGMGNLPLFIVFFIILLFVCYVTKSTTQRQFAQNIIYYCFFSIVLLMVFVSSTPYRAILFVPFLQLILLMNQQEIFGINLLLEFFLSASYMIYALVNFFWCFSSKSLSYMLLYKFTNLEVLDVDPLYSAIGNMSYLKNIALAIFFAAALLLLILNHPKLVKYLPQQYTLKTRFLFSCRSYFMALFVLFPILIYFGNVTN